MGSARLGALAIHMPTQQNEPFVKSFEKAIMQYVILNKAKQGEVTKENLQQTFRGALQMPSGTDHFTECIQTLVQSGHLKEQGNKYTITDDGREDVQKVQQLALEIPNVVQGQGQGQGRQTMGQQQTTGARGGSNPQTYPSGGSQQPPQGNVGGGQNRPQNR